jgi:RHS repeat-associated protein
MRIKVLWRGAATVCLGLSAFAANAQEVVRYIHTDALGSPVAESDEGGSIVARFAYEPYGGSVGAGIEDGPGFTGHVSDKSTGLTYMQQRYYDPDVAQFLSVDPVTATSDPVGMFSRYRYANSNPYAYVDPDGRRACGQSTTCRLLQGEAGSVIRSGSGSQNDRSENEAVKIAAKAAAEATARTSGLREREYPTAGSAARAWFNAVMPVGIKYQSEIGVRIFQGMNKGAVLGNSVSDGYQYRIEVSTLYTSVSTLGDAAIGFAHTHPGTDFFSRADLIAGQNMYSRTNRSRTTPLDFEVFVGLTDRRMYGWSYVKNGGDIDAGKYSTP